jgi:TRAP-type C4-dicarboxylate transport system substrate-binding protein
MNMDVWNSLPSDLQAIVEKAAWERVLWCATEFYRGEYIYVNEMGLEGIRWPAEDIATLNAAAVPFWEREAAKSARCADAVQILKDWQAIVSGGAGAS